MVTFFFCAIDFTYITSLLRTECIDANWIERGYYQWQNYSRITIVYSTLLRVLCNYIEHEENVLPEVWKQDFKTRVRIP